MLLPRLLAGLLAAGLMVTSTVTASSVYLCLMEGGLHRECCCELSGKRQPPPEDRLQSARSACCVLQAHATGHPPARAEADARSVLPAPIATLPLPVDPPRHADAAVATPLEARGPPLRAAPELFIRDCSYLI